MVDDAHYFTMSFRIVTVFKRCMESGFHQEGLAQLVLAEQQQQEEDQAQQEQQGK